MKSFSKGMALMIGIAICLALSALACRSLSSNPAPTSTPQPTSTPKPAELLLGTWEDTDAGQTWEFLADGKLKLDTLGATTDAGSYEILDQNTLRLTIQLMGMQEVRQVRFQVRQDSLTLWDADGNLVAEYLRVK